MRSRAVLGVVIAITAVVAVAAPGLALGQSPAGASQTQPTPATSTAANTTIAIHPRPDGDARFRVSTTFVLNGTNESAAFRALAREFEDGNAGYSVSTFRQAANESSIVTGRSMSVTNVTRNATIVGENTSRADTGRLVLGFTWTNFARTNGDRVVVGDAFNTTHGTWLPGLTANQTLLIESPRRYTITQSPVGFSNGTVRLEGPTTFEPGTPVVAFERRGGTTPTEGANGDGLGPLMSMPLLAVGAGVTVLGVAVLGVYVLTHRDETGERVAEGGRTEASAPDEPPDDMPQTDATDANTAVDAGVDSELLSDEERVEQLLERNDGRMKQASIVDATGWSNAKVSQLLSAMDEDDRIDKLRIGRENLISLPDEE
jgi:hypothetical protein